MIKPFDTVKVIDYSIPAGKGTLIQGLLIIMYGSE
jgi:hypothetical protein